MERKKLYCDLHTHTRYSDGMFLEPRELVRLAHFNGIDVLAVTDHDNCFGYDEAQSEGERLGMNVIPGAEITTPDYHLLALNFNPNDEGFAEFLKKSRGLQKEKCKLRVQKLRENGLPILMENVYEMFNPEKTRIGKFNVFVAMMFNPECRRIMYEQTPELGTYERFRHYMSNVIGKLPDFGVNEEEAINAVHSAGGVIGIAHPFKEIKDMDEMNRLVRLGIDFLEVQPNYRGRENKRYTNEDFERFALQNGLPISYGSDYHGPSFNRELLLRGENVLSENLEELLNRGYVKISRLGKFLEVCC